MVSSHWAPEETAVEHLGKTLTSISKADGHQKTHSNLCIQPPTSKVFYTSPTSDYKDVVNVSLRFWNSLGYDCRRPHEAKVDKPTSQLLCNKNISCQPHTVATENLSLWRLVSIWDYWSMGFLQLDFFQMSRTQDKLISLSTNTIRVLTCPVTESHWSEV